MISSHEMSDYPSPEIKFDTRTKLFLLDVDDTVAEVYTPAAVEMIDELSGLLNEEKVLFFVTGGSFRRVENDIIRHIEQPLRKNIIVSHCSGAEVWGFNENGHRRVEPFYSLYDEKLTDTQKDQWHKIIEKLVEEFHLETHDVLPIGQFHEKYGTDPRTIIKDDRGPQITLEFINAFKMSPRQAMDFGIKEPNFEGNFDLRPLVFDRGLQYLTEAEVPVSPRYGGDFALDFAIQGVSKTTSIKHVLESDEILATVGLKKIDLVEPFSMEVGGDKFAGKGGSDFNMVKAVMPGVRVIDFRREDSSQFPEGSNILVWEGQKQLSAGFLEYLQSRH